MGLSDTSMRQIFWAEALKSSMLIIKYTYEAHQEWATILFLKGMGDHSCCCNIDANKNSMIML